MEDVELDPKGTCTKQGSWMELVQDHTMFIILMLQLQTLIPEVVVAKADNEPRTSARQWPVYLSSFHCQNIIWAKMKRNLTTWQIISIRCKVMKGLCHRLQTQGTGPTSVCGTRRRKACLCNARVFCPYCRLMMNFSMRHWSCVSKLLNDYYEIQ